MSTTNETPSSPINPITATPALPALDNENGDLQNLVAPPESSDLDNSGSGTYWFTYWTDGDDC